MPKAVGVLTNDMRRLQMPFMNDLQVDRLGEGCRDGSQLRMCTALAEA